MKIKTLLIVFLLLLIANLNYAEDIKVKNIKEDLDKKYFYLVSTDKLVAYITVYTPEFIRYQVDRAIDEKKIDKKERENKIKELEDFFEIKKGFCVIIKIFNKFWPSYNPNIGEISKRIFIEDDKGHIFSYRSVIQKTYTPTLNEGLDIIISYPKNIKINEVEHLYLTIRGIDENAVNEKPVKVELNKDILAY